MSHCPGHGVHGGPGGRYCNGEKKRQVQRSLKHARFRSSSYGGDLRSNQRHWPELSARITTQADNVNWRTDRPVSCYNASISPCNVLIRLLSVALSFIH